MRRVCGGAFAVSPDLKINGRAYPALSLIGSYPARSLDLVLLK